MSDLSDYIISSDEEDDVSDTKTFLCEKAGPYYLKNLTYDEESCEF